MLDSFLEVACEHEKKASAYQSLVADMRRLPKAELQALASGRSKLASLYSSLCGDDGNSWLSKFEGTPLHEQALALEQQSLELDIAREQRRLAEAEEEDASRAVRDEEYRAEDAVRLKKRILDLELNKLKLEASTGVPAEATEEDVEEEATEEPVEGVEEEAPEGEVEEEPEEEEVLEEEEPEELEEETEEGSEEEETPKEPPEKESKKPPSAEEVKKAAVRMRFKLASYKMRKEALGLGAALSGGWKGLRAAGGALRQQVGRSAGVALTRGLSTGVSHLGGGVQQMVPQAAYWAKQNPAAALGAAGILGAGTMGAGALGGSALGFVAGRGTARR